MSDISITAGNVIKGANAKTRTKTAGVSITAGQVLYLDTADSFKAKLADDNLSAAASVVEGIALHAALAGQPIEYVYEDDDFTFGGTAAIGDVLILSSTAGGIAPVADLAAGHYLTVLGVAKSTTKIKLKFLSAGAPKAA